MRLTQTHLFFWRDADVFSQWYPSPFTAAGVTFPTAEHYMMYKKAMAFDDKEIANKILTAKYPKEVKELGRKVKNFDEAHWDAVKESVVTLGSILKFNSSEKLMNTLLDTGDLILVEASPYDKIWGIGLEEMDPRVLDESKWQGQNLLGICLMNARAIVCDWCDEV